MNLQGFFVRLVNQPRIAFLVPIKHKSVPKKILGQGTVYLMAAEVVFMGSGYVMHFAVGRWLGPGLYGIFGLVLYLTVMLRAAFLEGIPKAVSKYTAEDNSNANAIKKEAIRIQIVLSTFIFVIFFSLSGTIASMLNDPRLAPHLRLSAFMIPLYSLYLVFTGTLSGLRRFRTLSLTYTIYALARMGLVLVLIFLGFSVGGAVLGLVLAAFVGMLVAYNCCRSGVTSSRFRRSKLIGFGTPIIVYSVAVFLLLDVDLLFVKGLLSENVLVGLYTSAKTLARVPYFVFAALSTSLFPSIARSFSMNDIDLTKKYINQSLRYTLIISFPIAFIVSGTADSLIETVYSASFAGAGPSLSILIFALSFFSGFMILSTIIMGIGHPGISTILAAVMLLVNVFLNFILIPRYQLLGGALAASVSFLLGLALAAAYVYAKFHTLVNPSSLLRIFVASAIVYIISIKFSIPGIPLFGQYICLFALYLVLLLFLREIRKEDIGVARGIFTGLLGQ